MLKLIKRDRTDKAEIESPVSATESAGTHESAGREPTNLVTRMRQVCEAAAKGDLEQRISGIEERGDLAELAWNINALLDITILIKC